MREKPTCGELRDYLENGDSLRKISDKIGFSVPYVSDMCKECGLDIPNIGRPIGYKMSKESKDKISESNRK